MDGGSHYLKFPGTWDLEPGTTFYLSFNATLNPTSCFMNMLNLRASTATKTASKFL